MTKMTLDDRTSAAERGMTRNWLRRHMGPLVMIPERGRRVAPSEARAYRRSPQARLDALGISLDEVRARGAKIREQEERKREARARRREEGRT